MNSVEIIEIMENYIAKIRPPKEIRDKVDINYRLGNQSIVLFEIRPIWNDKTKYQTHDFAKAIFNKKNNIWKIYWLGANLKWNLYRQQPTVKNVRDFIEVVDLDTHGCFKG
jgi:hypothetical protein